ncbi:MAG: hypothetical protein KF713_17605 [Turneriella sp.]|nr:hypothetical protein [Turneriella sp.]
MSTLSFKHRAEFDTFLAKLGFTSYVTLIDTRPNLMFLETGDLENSAQCAHCTFIDFLGQHATPDTFPELAGLRRFFAATQEISAHARQGNTARLVEILTGLGAQAVFEFDPGAGQGEHGLGLRKLRRVSTADLSVPIPVLRGGDENRHWLLLEPSAAGLEPLFERIRECRGQGYENVILGYAEHAAAIEQWSAFWEKISAENWTGFLLHAFQAGIRQIHFMTAFSPCASLQFRENMLLEKLRSDMDTRFRQLDETASMMCPENVSGYSLVNDVREFMRTNKAERKRFAIRHDNIVALF